MPNYDKYDPISGGSRAKLAANLTLNAAGGVGPVAVSLNAAGRAVIGTAGQSGLFGILVKNVARGPIGPKDTQLHGGLPNPNAPIAATAGEVVDIMQHGDIVGLDPAVFVAGTKFYAAADGSISATNTGIPIGWTVEAGRLVVRIAA